MIQQQLDDARADGIAARPVIIATSLRFGGKTFSDLMLTKPQQKADGRHHEEDGVCRFRSSLIHRG
jgi:hypothetical protein